MDARRYSPAAERNRAPILEVLRRVLPARGQVLEIASGSGQHACYFAEELPGLTWQPSDHTPVALASIEAWRHTSGLDNLRPPVPLDVTAPAWSTLEGHPPYDALFNANMLHISPWTTCAGLMRGAREHLAPGAPLVVYGPFQIDGQHTAESNRAFDRSLQQRDPRWGVRDLGDVIAEAERHGIEFVERVAMPKNNFTLVFRTH